MAGVRCGAVSAACQPPVPAAASSGPAASLAQRTPQSASRRTPALCAMQDEVRPSEQNLRRPTFCSKQPNRRTGARCQLVCLPQANRLADMLPSRLSNAGRCRMKETFVYLRRREGKYARAHRTPVDLCRRRHRSAPGGNAGPRLPRLTLRPGWWLARELRTQSTADKHCQRKAASVTGGEEEVEEEDKEEEGRQTR